MAMCVERQAQRHDGLLDRLGDRCYFEEAQSRALSRTGEAVADHFEEAVRTLRKLPPVRVTGYFNAWPEVLRSAKEIAAMEPEPM